MRAVRKFVFAAVLVLLVMAALPREPVLVALLPFRVSVLYFRPPDPVLLMPVKGVPKRAVAETFGAPRGRSRKHEGADIFAPRGTPVLSATRGIVTRITNKPLGGNSVFVVGAGGRRYFYTHLERYGPVDVGDSVTPRTVLGYVGTSGNARGTPPHLHFGVYGPEGAIDPLPLLADRRQAAR